MGHAIVTLLVVAVGVAPATGALYLLTLVLAALRHRERGIDGAPRTPLVVLVPAHDEAVLVGRCIASLRDQRYPAALRRIVVIADNCGDATAAVARAAGAEVLVRDAPDAVGKGRALRWAMDLLLADDATLGAFVVVDADSVAEPDLLAGLEARLRAGAEVVQAEYSILLDGEGAQAALRAAAFRLFHGARFAGRAVLGMPCNLVGNGMLFSRGAIEAHPWSAFSSAEDLEYSADLRLAGVRPVFASEARLAAPAARTRRGADAQRRRWEGGRFHVVRTRLWRLVAAAVTRDWRLADAALDLAVPPLGLLLLVTIAGAAVSVSLVLAGLAAPVAAAPWVATLVLVPAYVLVGLRATHAPAAAYRSLLHAPLFLLAKVGTYARLARRGLETDRWERSERPEAGSAGVGDDDDAGSGPAAPGPGAPAGGAADAPHPGGDAQPLAPAASTAPAASPAPAPAPAASVRVDIGGVPIDRVGSDEACDRVMDAVARRRPLQVCTINLQFLATAWREPATLAILRASELNVADGMPVVWLSRLLGKPLPGRLAGADLVDALMSRGAVTGASFFLLGGRPGAAEEAARRLASRHPGVRIAGTYEPPAAPIEAMDGEDILRRLRASGADVLLVAFGHPKQERWIAAHRARLPVPVAIGVGCTLDIAAGMVSRAPLWMQRAGLEWLYRVAHEPRRLTVRYARDLAFLLFLLLPTVLAQRVVVTVARDRRAPRGAG